MAIEHADFDGIERLALVTGGEIVSTFDNPDLVKLGHCKLIEEVCSFNPAKGVPNIQDRPCSKKVLHFYLELFKRLYSILMALMENLFEAFSSKTYLLCENNDLKANKTSLYSSKLFFQLSFYHLKYFLLG